MKCSRLYVVGGAAWRRCFSSTPFLANASNKRTCLYDFHVKNGGEMVNFAGFSMPIRYDDLSIADSSKHTRSHVSVFDVSHMLQTEVVGKDREPFMESLTTSDVEQLAVNTGCLSVFTNENGGIRDDLILSKTDRDSIYVVTNAGCVEKDLPYLQKAAEKWRRSGKDVQINVLDTRALVAVQGPEAATLLREASDIDVDRLYFMHTTVGTLYGVEGCRITRCGYTGEDGFELSVDAKHAESLVAQLLASKSAEVRLAGLGARDVLRLEAGLCLYGNDINESTTPAEASLAFVVAKRRWKTLGFPGAEKVVEQIENKSIVKKRVGLIGESGRCPRSHCPIADTLRGTAVGFVTSGCPSPTLGKNIAMAYVDAADSKIGSTLLVQFERKSERVTVSRMPFVPTKYHVAPK